MLSQRQLILRKYKSIVGIGVGGTLAFAGIGVWSGNDKFYQQFLTPVLNRLDPEWSHNAAIFLAKYKLVKAAPINNPPELETKIASLTLPNPIGLAAGFDKNAECIPGLTRFGLGWVEIGSVTPKPQPGNPKPRVFRLPEDCAVINRYGFNSDGKDVVRERVSQFKKDYPEYIVGVNLGANKESADRVKDYCEGIEAFSESADYFVINISSPNTPNLRDLQQSESLSGLLKRVIATRDGQSRRVPLFLKVAPDLDEKEIKSICDVVKSKNTKVDGLIVSNTTVQRTGLKSDTSLVEQVGGLSGRPLEKASTALVGKFYTELKGELPIIGVGGVWNGTDAFNKICAGASAVQMYTALVYQGPGAVDRIKNELLQALSEHGFVSVQEAIGSQHKGLTSKSRWF